MTGERSSSGGKASPQAATELSSLGLSCQDSPLLGLLSAVSRPAVSFLQRWSPLVSGRSLKQDLVEQQSEFLQQLDVLPPQQLHSLPWFNLSELGISSLEGPQIQQTFQDPPGLQAPTLMGHVLLHPAPGTVANTWLSGLLSGSEDERLKPAKAGLFTSGMDQTLPPPRLSHLPSGLPHLPPGLLHSLGALSPDLDNGYSSLEEEQLQAAKAQLQTTSSTVTEKPAAEEEEQEEEQKDVPVLKCDNKAIAFIMGCPCSDDSGSDSDDDDDDDGFDSVCSSEISDSDDEEEKEEVEELDSEAECLWSALCQNHDPYNPRNFTAILGSTPRPIPRSGPAPETSPSSVDSSCSSSSSSSSSSWDEASETEQETMKLLTAFCSSDPYSPLNFQASIRTKPKGLETKPDPKVDPDPEEGRVRTSSESSHSSSRATRKKKKQVRFQAEVLVFAVGCEERRGPWEELARDRARFAKRCGDIEHILSSYLQPEHRRRVYLRISQE